jgi:CD109 antigen
LFILALAILLLAVLAWYLTGEETETADTFFFTVPKVLKAGEINYVGYTLTNGSKPAKAKITIEFGDIRKELTISGNGKFELPAPNKEGTYKLKIEAEGFSGEAEVKVVKDVLVFVETDKPIYKPGQTVHIRLIAVDSMLRKAEDDVVVEILDAKGVKVFKKNLHVDGMTSIDFPLSNDPNLGVWKIRVLRGDDTINQLDFRVERYVLPKYEVKVATRDWVLPDEKIKGAIEAKYVFGKPVKGEYLVEAYRYVGRWDKYAEAKGKIDGKAEFELPPVEYVVASPHQQAGGLLLNVTVFEENTSYRQTVSKMIRVVPSEIDVKIIPEGSSFKPGIPFKVLIVTKTQDGKLVDKAVKLVIQKISKDDVKKEELEVKTEKGKKIIELKPEDWVESIAIQAMIDGKSVAFTMISRAISKSFYLHVEKVRGDKVGDEYEFKVYYPKGKQVYYEVVSKGVVLFTDFVRGGTIRFTATPEMAPESKIVVYSFSGSEVVADYLTFAVEPTYRTLKVEVDKEDVKPREEVTIRFDASNVGVSIVDKSVFVLAENRLNLEDVFRKLEELYGEPKVEVHLAPCRYKTIGSYDVFENSGLAVLTNKQMTKGETGVVKKPQPFDFFGIFGVRQAIPEVAEVGKAVQEVAEMPMADSGLAEVKLVRQFFPETWFFGFSGNELKLKAPDTITTWAIHAVTLDDGLRIGSGEIRVFQPFFIKADFPYSIVRGEEVELKAVIYNYAEDQQRVLVTVEELESGKEIAREWINVSNIAEVRFKFKADEVGVKKFKITARSKDFADAVIKELRVVPEGVTREDVENVVVKDGDVLHFSTKLNIDAVPDSERYYLAISGSYMAQTISGLDRLIRMPFGCGEQNMILMAPGVYVAKYLIATNQMKPEIMAKAEMMATVGYQRELTFMRSDGSFSAFGENDREGSTFLTAFVVRTFAEAKDIIYIDDSVIEKARDWLLKHKRSDGSFETVGFIHHRDMMGGISGDYAMTAYVTISLLEAGYYEDVRDSIGFLERGFSSANNYSKALACYALALAGKDYSDELLKIAVRDGNKMFIPTGNKVTDVEATAYAVLALTKLGKPEASFFVAWLVEQRNPNGGFYSTQDTVMAIKALAEYSSAVVTNVDLTIRIRYGDEIKTIGVNGENADVTQIVELPAGKDVSVEVEGRGKAIVQFVKRYNVIPIKVESPIKLDVSYDTSELEEKGILRIAVHYECSLPVEMTVIDVAVPTGFVPDEESLRKVECKRFEVADRKVIFYLDVSHADFEFYAKPVFVISSKTPLVSVAYSYYEPEVKAEVVRSVHI